MVEAKNAGKESATKIGELTVTNVTWVHANNGKAFGDKSPGVEKTQKVEIYTLKNFHTMPDVLPQQKLQ